MSVDCIVFRVSQCPVTTLLYLWSTHGHIQRWLVVCVCVCEKELHLVQKRNSGRLISAMIHPVSKHSCILCISFCCVDTHFTHFLHPHICVFLNYAEKPCATLVKKPLWNNHNLLWSLQPVGYKNKFPHNRFRRGQK